MYWSKKKNDEPSSNAIAYNPVPLNPIPPKVNIISNEVIIPAQGNTINLI